MRFILFILFVAGISSAAISFFSDAWRNYQVKKMKQIDADLEKSRQMAKDLNKEDAEDRGLFNNYKE